MTLLVKEGGVGRKKRRRENVRIHCWQHFDNESKDSIQRFNLKKGGGVLSLAVWKFGN